MAWRMMKCQGSSPSRSATGGLAAKLSTMPTISSRISAASNGLSIVHHHSAMGVLRSRENMVRAALPGGLPKLLARTLALRWLARSDRNCVLRVGETRLYSVRLQGIIQMDREIAIDDDTRLE